MTTQFLKMEAVLDNNVNHKVELQIERGGEPLTLDLTVRYKFFVTCKFSHSLSLWCGAHAILVLNYFEL